MAKIELRDATVCFVSGMAGTGTVNNAAGLTDGATTADVDGIVLNTETADVIPVGARFTVAGEATAVEHVVTAVTPAVGGPTTQVTFSPAIEVGSAIADDAAMTFIGQQIEVKIGEGNITYTESKDYTYELDRGRLDTVREGDDIPVSVTMNFVYEFVRTGTNEEITPSDAVKGIGGAADWISASSDKCEPYAVDLVIKHEVACSGTVVEREITTFPTFRWDQLQFDLGAASVSVTGRAFTTEAVIQRVA